MSVFQDLRADRLKRLLQRLDRFGLSGPEQRMVRSWVKQILRRRSLPDPLLDVVLCRLVDRVCPTGPAGTTGTAGAAGTADRLDQHCRAALRFAARQLNHDRTSETVDELLAVFSAYPAGEWIRQLRRVQENSAERMRQRVGARCEVDSSLSSSVETFLRYLVRVTRYPTVPAVEFVSSTPEPNASVEEELREFQAYTNGIKIFLPKMIGCAADDRLNEAFYFYLVVHELMHLVSTYDFSFSTNAGRHVWRLLKPLRDRTGQQSRLRTWRPSRKLQRKLQAEGIDLANRKLPSTPDLTRLVLHFPDRRLAQVLLNCFEDARIETQIETQFPGLARVNRAMLPAIDRTGLSCYAVGGIENLLHAVFGYIIRQPVSARVPQRHRELYQSVVDVIDRHERRKDKSIYSSARATWRVYRLLEPLLSQECPDSGRSSLTESFSSPIDVEEVEVRLRLRESEKLAASPGGLTWFEQLDYEPAEPGVWLPELVGGVMRQRAVHVTAKPFRRNLDIELAGEEVPDLDLPFPPIRSTSGEASRNRGRLSRTFHEFGQTLASERFGEWLASRAAGAGFQDVPLLFDRTGELPQMVTLVFDLSVSMETVIDRKSGHRRIDRALSMGRWMARAFERQGMTVDAYGAMDSGAKRVELFYLPPGSPASVAISKLHPMGVGGFRVGALIRALARRRAALQLPQETPEVRRTLVLFTDADTPFLSAGYEESAVRVRTNRCPTCDSRRTCVMDEMLSVGWGGADQIAGWRDARRAIDSTRKEMKTHLVVFNESPSFTGELLDSILGRETWSSGWRNHRAAIRTAMSVSALVGDDAG